MSIDYAFPQPREPLISQFEGTTSPRWFAFSKHTGERHELLGQDEIQQHARLELTSCELLRSLNPDLESPEHWEVGYVVEIQSLNPPGEPSRERVVICTAEGLSRSFSCPVSPPSVVQAQTSGEGWVLNQADNQDVLDSIVAGGGLPPIVHPQNYLPDGTHIESWLAVEAELGFQKCAVPDCPDRGAGAVRLCDSHVHLLTSADSLAFRDKRLQDLAVMRNHLNPRRLSDNGASALYDWVLLETQHLTGTSPSRLEGLGILHTCCVCCLLCHRPRRPAGIRCSDCGSAPYKRLALLRALDVRIDSLSCLLERRRPVGLDGIVHRMMGFLGSHRILLDDFVTDELSSPADSRRAGPSPKASSPTRAQDRSIEL